MYEVYSKDVYKLWFDPLELLFSFFDSFSTCNAGVSLVCEGTVSRWREGLFSGKAKSMLCFLSISFSGRVIAQLSLLIENPPVEI